MASPLQLLDQLGSARVAIVNAMATVKISSGAYAALEATRAAVHALAEALGHPDHFAATPMAASGPDWRNASRHDIRRAAMPSMPDLTTYTIAEDEDGTYAVTYATTGTIVVLNGKAQSGLALDDADDVADHLEAIDRLVAARGTGTLNS